MFYFIVFALGCSFYISFINVSYKKQLISFAHFVKHSLIESNKLSLTKIEDEKLERKILILIEIVIIIFGWFVILYYLLIAIINIVKFILNK